jgi:hypothetical protein
MLAELKLKPISRLTEYQGPTLTLSVTNRCFRQLLPFVHSLPFHGGILSFVCVRPSNATRLSSPEAIPERFQHHGKLPAPAADLVWLGAIYRYLGRQLVT